jgi:Holliday junction resolvase-like predicted endonuclease
MIARLMFAIVDFAARKGLTEPGTHDSPKQQAWRTGVRDETYAYWYMRRHGYVLVARNYRSPGIKGEIDMIGYDGEVLAFVEERARSAAEAEISAKNQTRPEEAVNWEKRRNLTRMARQFLRARRIERASCRFDVMAIENHVGSRPHEGAFAANAG